MRVLITGVAHGIGAATASALRARGAEVVGLDVVPGADWHQLDLTCPDAVDHLDVEGRFDALVHAAGLPPRAGLEAAILTVNFLALRRLTGRVLPHLVPGGAICSVASKAGAKWRENLDQVRRLMALDHPDQLVGFVRREGIDPVRAYDLSKEALIVWTKAQTAALLAHGLRANTVSPAAIETRILEDFRQAFGARADRATALSGRVGQPHEVAEVVAFLIGPESGWIRGIDLAVDGGVEAQMICKTLDIPQDASSSCGIQE